MKTHFFVKHWVAAFAISVLTMVIGLVSLVSLPVEQYPDIAPPMVTVQATYSGADAHAVMESVVMPLEEVINGVENMIYMDATATANGEGEIDIYFEQGTDADEATVNVQNRVSQASGVLPEDVIRNGITIQKNVNATLMIMSLESTDGKFDQSFISNYLDINVMPAISRIAGVGRTMVMGEQYGVRIWLKPDLMGLYGVTPDEIIAAINEQNLVVPIGRLESATDKIDIEFNGLLDDMSQFENIIIRASEKGEILRLHDLAEVELGAKAYDFRTNISGKPGVMFYVKQAPGANATKVNAEIKKVLADVEKRLPAGLEFKLLETSDDFLYASMYSVVETLIVAILLVILVVYFFLQDIKATIIPSVTIVISLIGTFAIVKVAGFSLNLLTLFALVLAIGTVVDDAIVVVEAVMAKLEKGPALGAAAGGARAATREAMSEVSVAVISCTLVFMAVFIPVAFMPGTSGSFFTQFGVTIASAVGLSCVSALTLCPALCAIMLKATEGKKERKNLTYYTKKAYTASYNAIFKKYSKSVQKFIKRPVLAWILLGVAAFLLIFFMRNLPSGLVPQEDQGVILAEIRAPEGTTLQQTREIVRKVEEKVKEIPEMESFATACGYGMMSGSGSNYATMIVRLKTWEDRPGFNHYVDLVIGRLYFACKEIKNVQVMPFQLPQVPGYGSNNSVNLVLQDLNDGDLSEFARLANNFLTKLGERPEISMAMTSYSERFPKYQVNIDPTQCDRAGVSPAAVLRTLGAYCGGSYVGNFNQFGKVYRIMASASPEYRLEPSSLNNIFVRVSGGKMAPISEFVTLKEVVGTSNIEHFNLFQSITCFVQAAGGYTEGDAHKVIAEVFKETMPNGYSYEYSGMSRELEEASGSNATALIYIICVILIYLILASLYNSWFTPWAVLCSVPFGLMGAFIFAYLGSLLHLPGMDNNIYLQTGVIMLIGLLSKTAILITEFASERRAQGMSIKDAAFAACQERLRPILMTVVTMIAGMIPLVIEGGAGANGNRALALGVIGGMTVGTIALLFVVPAFFIVFQKLHERFQGAEVKSVVNEE